MALALGCRACRAGSRREGVHHRLVRALLVELLREREGRELRGVLQLLLRPCPEQELHSLGVLCLHRGMQRVGEARRERAALLLPLVHPCKAVLGQELLHEFPPPGLLGATARVLLLLLPLPLRLLTSPALLLLGSALPLQLQLAQALLLLPALLLLALDARALERLLAAPVLLCLLLLPRPLLLLGLSKLGTLRDGHVGPCVLLVASICLGAEGNLDGVRLLVAVAPAGVACAEAEHGHAAAEGRGEAG
mmetsp:Transcript_27012/g.84425  ORF Transcript_27012/g.84425 Transcript_27012/m.84425 type:complete len:250 (-) Transcript_27012:47-796(-)